MNLEFFIAKKLAASKDSGNRLSRLMSYVSIISVGIGIAVMILSVAIVTGFKKEITAKLVGGFSHIQIVNLDANFSFETHPINANQISIENLQKINGVKHIQRYITKGGIIKTEKDIQGVMLKGIDCDFDWNFFENCIVEGRKINISDTANTNDIMISKNLANKLLLNLGDKIDVYFVQDPPRIRRFSIVGIYATQMEEIDNALVLCDIKHLQKIYGWNRNQISGYEISIDNIKNISAISDNIADQVAYTTYSDGSRVNVTDIMQNYAHLFGWLNLLDTNVIIILLLTIAVAGFSMVSGLLIMLLERTSMIGILKSLGMHNFNIRKLFLYRVGFIVTKGIILGNLLGIACCLIQKYFEVVKLDASNYFVSTVPINLNPLHIILISAASIAVIMIVLLIPTHIIAKISPEKTIRFE